MKRKRGGIVSQLLMILLVVVIIFPLYFMTANSFKTHEEYVNNMAGLPQTFTVQNFVEAFRGKSPKIFSLFPLPFFLFIPPFIFY